MSTQSQPISRIRFPFRQSNVLLSVDYVETDRTWTLWIESGIRRHSVRLSRSLHDQSTAENLALMSAGQTLLEHLMDDTRSAHQLAHSITVAIAERSEEPLPPACFAYLSWRLCEEIANFRTQQAASA